MTCEDKALLIKITNIAQAAVQREMDEAAEGDRRALWENLEGLAVDIEAIKMRLGEDKV